MLRISPITTRKRSSSKTKAAYKNMHNKAFPSTKPSLNAYIKMHKEAFPSNRGLSKSAYIKMHKVAFPSPRRTRKSRGSRS